MQKGEQAKKMVSRWVDKVGPSEAKRRLINEHVGFSTADKIVRADYPNIPGYRITKILLAEMAKDGISLKGDVAS